MLALMTLDGITRWGTMSQIRTTLALLLPRPACLVSDLLQGFFKGFNNGLRLPPERVPVAPVGWG